MSVIWVDIISEIVEDVRNDSSKPDALDANQPYYLYGHPKEIFNTLNEQDRSNNYKFKNFPLIALFQDFTESYGDSALILSEVSLNIAIITETSKDYKANERYDNSFKDLLQPLYELLISKLIASKQFLEIDTGLLPHDKTDRLYWGTTSGNITNGYIDAIEIENLELKLGTLTKKC